MPRRTRVLLWASIVWFSFNQLNGRGIHWAHSGKGGGILTIKSTHWWTISGILVRTRNTQTFLYFRRRPRWMVSKKK